MMERLQQFISDLLLGLAKPFIQIFVSGDNRLFWVWLITAVFISYWMYRRALAQGESGAQTGFLPFLFPKAIWRHPSAATDIGVMVVSSVLLTALLSPIIMKQQAVTDWLLTLFDPATSSAAGAGVAVIALYTVTLFVVDDLTKFLGHYLMHRVPALWELHKVHHAAEVLTPITAYRIHPLERVLTAALVATSLGGTTAAFVIFFGSSISPITLFNANIGLVAFNLFGGTLRHSHIWFSYGPQLEKFFISPAMHQIHHSAERRHFDKNLGYHLAIWDRLAGTLHIPEGREIFALGIGPEGERIRGVTSSLVQPVVSTLATLVPRARPST
jgi:sterol desaturase/sphingolipid hydroxylase (fatty acid hydroxylase superfamily)